MVSKACMAVMAAMASAGLAAALGQSATPSTEPAPTTQADATTRPSPEVLRLIGLMAAPKFQTRAHAQTELVRMGAAVEPALKQAADESSSAEIRTRAADAVIEIEQNIADAPTYITLHVTKAPSADVFKEISRQAGVKVTTDSDTGPITLDLDQVPFWSAMKALCTATHTHLQPNGPGGPAGIDLASGDAGHWDLEGRFAFIPTMINHDSNVDLINGGAFKNDGIIMMAFLDPKFHSATFDGIQLDVAKDEHGASLIRPGMMAPNFFNPGFQQGWCYTLNAPLVFPESFGHTLALLEGTSTVHVPMGTSMLKIPDMIKAVGTTTIAGNHKVDVVQCNFPGGNVITVHLQISKLDRSAGLNYPGGLFAEFQSARVVDSQGQQLMGGGGGGGTDMQIDWQGQFSSGVRPLKPPFSLTWEIITHVETVTVPFKFKNLPLPPQ
jgi:hypothetical protein